MKDFIHTGYNESTMTTVDDPSLLVIEIDNGNTWTINFYCGHTLIDMINMEHLNGQEMDENVKDLPVVCNQGGYLGTVRERVLYSLSLRQ